MNFTIRELEKVFKLNCFLRFKTRPIWLYDQTVIRLLRNLLPANDTFMFSGFIHEFRTRLPQFARQRVLRLVSNAFDGCFLFAFSSQSFLSAFGSPCKLSEKNVSLWVPKTDERKTNFECINVGLSVYKLK